MITPQELKKKFPISKVESNNIIRSRKIISNIIHGMDHRLLVICGPCSIHEIDATIEYAHRLYSLSMEVSNHIYVIMRVYFEKPRTSIGWKGLINDPYINGSFNIEDGLQIARNLLLKLVKIGIPLATEILDPNSLHYLSDLFSWSSIGARTIESQIHREIASGLSMPVGFKNRIDGSLTSAINAMYVASCTHRFISINQLGKVCLLRTNGNPDCHIVLRGGKQPNYYPTDIEKCEKQINQAGFSTKMIVDCSHGNSNKNCYRQIDVAESVSKQIQSGNRSIIGLMLESYIHSGNQPVKLPREKMQYGVSITDACISWESTIRLVHQLYEELQLVLLHRYRKNENK